MTLPVRLSYSLRPGADFPHLAAAVVVAVVFAATPFLIPEIAASYDVSVGLAGGISLAQVGAFALVAFSLPRLTIPSPGVYRLAAFLLVTANLTSAVLDSFAILMIVRVVAGGATGALTWMAWSDAMGSPRSLASVSSAAPVATLLASPGAAALAAMGDRAIYLALAVIGLPLLFLRPRPTGQTSPSRRVSRSRSNRVLLLAVLMLTLFGAALFIYAAVAAKAVLGMSPLAASLGYSLNAAGGLLGARLSTRHRRPGVWLASSGPAAVLSIAGGHPVLYLIGLTWWGFAFWMGVPGVMQMLAARSLHPGERAGDAQAAMAGGRALAPLLGGGFADAGAFTTLALVSGAGLTVAGLSIVGVQEGRERLPPTDPAFGP